jgi:hypothetical protein
MTQQEAFEQGFSGFVPQTDDPPDNISFYRTFRGLEAAFGKDLCDKYNGAIHNAACDACCGGNATASERYQYALISLRHQADKMKVPEEPEYRRFWQHEPQEPGEVEAHNLFAEQFRARFPGQRINGKLAKEKWPQVRERALEIVHEKYVAAKAKYDAERAGVDEENARRKADWQERVARVESFKRIIAEHAAQVDLPNHEKR